MKSTTKEPSVQLVALAIRKNRIQWVPGDPGPGWNPDDGDKVYAVVVFKCRTFMRGAVEGLALKHSGRKLRATCLFFRPSACVIRNEEQDALFIMWTKDWRPLVVITIRHGKWTPLVHSNVKASKTEGFGFS